MTVELERDAAYEDSVLWRLHDAYFAARGTAAWTAGEIPYRSTSNFGIASQHARLLEAQVAELEAEGTLAPDAPVGVLELGCGLGELADNLLRALDPALAARVRYVISDYAAATVAGATAGERMQARIAAGQVISARFDVRAPAELVDLAGAPVDVPLAAVLASYVCCVTPLRVLRRDGDAWSGLTSTVTAPAPLDELLAHPTRAGLIDELAIAWGWREAPLEALVPDPFHRAVLARVPARPGAHLIRYPDRFLDALRALRRRLRRGGLALVTDYGSADGASLQGTVFKGPEHFGNTLNHGVDFSLFDHFGAIAGASVGRTRGRLRTVFTAAIRFDAMTPRFAEAFARHEQASSAGEDALDLAAAARAFATGDRAEPARAIRFYQRALELDPYSAALCHEAADACLDHGFLDLAEAYFERCAELDDRDRFDVEFELGRLATAAGRPRAAVLHYQASLAREEHPVTLANLGRAYLALGDYRSGHRALRRALELQPDSERARALLDELRVKWTDELAAE